MEPVPLNVVTSHLTEYILSHGARSAMNTRRISYDSADAIAEGIGIAVRQLLEDDDVRSKQVRDMLKEALK